MIPYGRQTIGKDDIACVVKVLNSDFITQGPKIKEFEDVLCKYTGAKYAVCVSSGTAALHIACLAAGIEKSDEVITSPITFVASANCVLYCGGKPVFADIEEDTVNISPQEIDRQVTKKTKAIIPVHFAGHPCDLKEIRNIAKKHNLIVIEDAAHALGAEYRGVKIGSGKYSDMTVFSFHPVKHITTGEGGAILTNKKRLYDRLLLFRNHGITKDSRKFQRFDGPWYYEMQELGLNYRITDFQCALGVSQLKKLGQFLKRRREIVHMYNDRLEGLSGIVLPVEKHGVMSSWHLYPVRIQDRAPMCRKRVFNYLRSKGIGVQVHYLPVYLQPYYRDLGYKRGICPYAEKFYAAEISLPLHPLLEDKDIEFITGVLRTYFKRNEA